MNHHRYSDDVVARIEQKLDDLIEKFDDHLKWADSQVFEDKCKFKDTSDRLAILETLLKKVQLPATAIGWLVITILTGSVLFWGTKLGEHIANHWQ